MWRHSTRTTARPVRQLIDTVLSLLFVALVTSCTEAGDADAGAESDADAGGNHLETGKQPPVTVLPVESSAGTTPHDVSIAIAGHVRPAVIGLTIDSTIFSPVSQATVCTVTSLGAAHVDGGGESIAGSGETIAVPVVHDETLEDGAYTERVRGTVYFGERAGWAPYYEFAADRPFEVVEGQVHPITQVEFDNRSDAAVARGAADSGLSEECVGWQPDHY